MLAKDEYYKIVDESLWQISKGNCTLTQSKVQQLILIHDDKKRGINEHSRDAEL